MGTLEGAQPPPLPLYILEVLGCQRHENISFLVQPYPSSSLSLVVLGEALLEYRAPPHHHAVVLLLDGVFPNLSFSPCWIKA